MSASGLRKAAEKSMNKPPENKQLVPSKPADQDDPYRQGTDVKVPGTVVHARPGFVQVRLANGEHITVQRSEVDRVCLK